MSKFNLKTYQKINGNQHIDSRLEENHKEAPNEINEKQLEDYRGSESNVLTEEQLARGREATKTQEATTVTERQLNVSKEKFDIKLRNNSAYEGDLPKLEEQRLKNDPVEDEKYKNSSETPKKLRWWEQEGESPDGLKLAQKKSATQKTAQYEGLTFDKPRFKDLAEDEYSPFDIDEEEAEEESAINPLESIKEEYSIEDLSDVENLPDFDIEDTTSLDKPVMMIEKEKELTGDFPGIYMVLNYSPEDFNGDELAIKQAALEKVLEERPEFKGIIDVSDFGEVKEDGGTGKVSLRSADQRLADVIIDKGDENIINEEQGFEEVSYEVQDIGGTPMASGEISFNEDINSVDRDKIIDDALEYIRETYNIEDITESSLDLALFDEGKIGFLIEAPSEGFGAEASVNFPVIEVTAQNIKKK